MVQKKNWEIEIRKTLLTGDVKNFSQLSLELRCNRDSLKKELIQLEKNGVIEKKKKGNETLYSLISDYTEMESHLIWDLSRMIKVEKDVDLVISKKYDEDYDPETHDVERDDGILSLYKLGKIKSVFTITNDVEGYGPRNKFEKERIEEIGEVYREMDAVEKEFGFPNFDSPEWKNKDKQERIEEMAELYRKSETRKDLRKKQIEWFSFKTNPKANKLLYYITDLHDYCVGKSIEAMMMEIFWPEESRTELGKTAREELQRLGLSVASKIRTHVLKSVGEKYARCYEMYLSNQSTLWLTLKDFINDPGVSPKKKRHLSDEEYKELGTKLIRKQDLQKGKKRD